MRTLKLYHHWPGKWSYFLENEFGGGSGMGTYKSAKSIKRMLAYRGIDYDRIQRFRWDGSDWIEVRRAQPRYRKAVTA